MRSVKFLLTAAAVSFSTMAFASDLPIAAPPVYAPPADFGGWYLRGDVGVTNQSLSRSDSNSASLFPQTAQLGPGFSGSPLSSLGVGYQANNLFRTEAAHAGLASRVTPSVTLELAQSYFDLGSARPGASTPFDATSWPSSTALKSITSNDLTLGALCPSSTGRASMSAARPATVPPTSILPARTRT
jgi:opacity protein-like surface antigen